MSDAAATAQTGEPIMEAMHLGGLHQAPCEEAPETADQLLNGMADLIERWGFCQGAMGDPGRGFCVHGAMDYVIWDTMPSRRFSGPVAIEALNRIERTIGTGRIIEWNDALGREKDEVVRILRQAAQTPPVADGAEAAST